MAPERFRGAEADARSDQYAFCVALFEALGGTRPFRGETTRELYEAARLGDVPLSELPSAIPGWVRAAMNRGLRPDRSERFETMGELLDQLGRDPKRTRRRTAALAGLGGVVVLAMAVGRSAASEAPEPCAETAHALDDVWSSAARTHLADRFESAAPALASSVTPRVQAALDGYANAWIESRRDACEATHVRREQSEARLDARMHCLDGRRRSLVAVLQTFNDADTGVVEHAVEAVASLPPVRPCAEASSPVASLPTAPSESAAVAAGLDRLAQSRALHAAGRFERARVLAEEIVEESEPLRYPPLTVGARQTLGSAQAALAQVEPAEANLRQAYHDARRRGVPEIGAVAAADVAYLLARHSTRHSTAKTWAQLAQTEGRLLGDRSIEAKGLNAFGIANAIGGDAAELEEAVAAFKAAIALYDEDPASPAVLTYQSNLARTVRLQGKIEEAAQMLEAILQEAERVLGPDHPSLLSYIDAMTEPLHILGRADEMVPRLERALEISTQHYGEAHPTTARVLAGLGSSRYRVGDLQGAKRDLERSVALSREMIDRGDLRDVFGLLPLAKVHLDLGDTEVGIGYLRETVEISDRAGGERRRDSAVARGELARALLGAGRPEEGLPIIDESVRIFEEIGGPEHVDVSEALQVRAQLESKLGRGDAAVADLQRAVAIVGKGFGEDSPKLAEMLLPLAEVQLVLQRYGDAHTSARRALALAEAGGTAPPAFLAAIKYGVARAIYLHEDDEDEAARYAREAIAGLRDGTPVDRDLAKKIAAWMSAQGL